MMSAIKAYTRPPSAIDSQVDFILLDSSGSMSPKWEDTLEAVQSYVDGLVANNLDSRIIFVGFDDTDLELIHRDCNIRDWRSLREAPVGAHFGGTPLYDAINLMGRRLRDLDPPRASIVIVTDGDEGASKFTNLTQARAILDWMRAKGWQITFIGCDYNNQSSASKLGSNAASAIGVERARLSDATTALARKRAAYGLYGTDMHFNEDEKEQFGGYLASPNKEDGA